MVAAHGPDGHSKGEDAGGVCAPSHMKHRRKTVNSTGSFEVVSLSLT